MPKTLFFLIALLPLFSCNNNTSTDKVKTQVMKEETVTYADDSISMNGFVSYDSNLSGKLPVVLLIHEWWGLNDNLRNKARKLASMGYLAFAIDMYGNGKIANNPDEAGKLAMPFYQNPTMAKSRFDAAMKKIMSYTQADSTRIAAIGFCFGGGMVLNMAKMGEPLKGVVSFHGNLAGVPADKSLLKARVLVCHGADDQFVKPEEVALFKKQMDSIGADYTFKVYPGAGHAFTNPDATRVGQQFKLPIAFNAAADSSSWKDMQDFFGKILK